MAKKAKKPPIKREYTLAGLIADAFSEFEGLAEEMGSWRDNLEEKFSATQKYEAVNQAAETLENLSAPSIPDWLEKADHEHKLSWEEPNVKKKSSRSARRDEACMMLDRAIEYLDNFIENIDSKEKPTDDEKSQKQDAEELRGDLDTAKEEADGVEFPGMFG